MKKLSVIIGIAVLFLFAGLSYGQDCGKCPLKCPSKKALSKDNVSDPIVYAKKGDKMYHQKNCKAVNDDYNGIKLSKALKAELKPCQECKPPVKVKPTATKKIIKKT